MNEIIEIDNAQLNTKQGITKIAKAISEIWKKNLWNVLVKDYKKTGLTITLSESGRAKVFMQNLKNRKICYPLNYCGHTEIDYAECNCHFQTVERVLDYFKKENKSINDVVRVEELFIPKLLIDLSEIDKNLYTIEIESNFYIKLLSFTFLANELTFSIKNYQINKEISKEHLTLLENWIEKIKNNLIEEKWIYEGLQFKLPALAQPQTTTSKLENKNIESELNNAIENFRKEIMRGMKKLPEYEIVSITNSGKRNEDNYRDYFKNFLEGADFICIPEQKHQRNYIDLKVRDKSDNVFKMEFKIWSNPDTKEVVKQIRKYLSQFDKVGFIFIINSNESSIIEKYGS